MMKRDSFKVEAHPQGFQARSEHHTLEVQVLAEDLFRLRWMPGPLTPPKPSWAVVKQDWPKVAATVGDPGGLAVLQTAATKFVLDQVKGTWKFEGSDGKVRFASVGHGLGMKGAEPFVRMKMTAEESVFGMGETTGTFNKRGLVREFWNIDVLPHAGQMHPSLRCLYVSIPFGISMRDGRTAGIFWDNPYRQKWDLGQTHPSTWEMIAAGGGIDLYLFAGPSVSSVVERFTELTGRMPLPPRWGLGYHQCRYSYETRERVEEVARTFREKRIPCDALYLDIHHMDGYRVFTFGKDFPKPARMIRQLGRKGFKVVAIVDPGVKDDPAFGVLQRGVAEDAFVRQPDGGCDYVGEVWPGKSRFPDFLYKKVREWWGREQAEFQKTGVAGIWNDMNEPANFCLPSKTLPEDCTHRTDHGPLPHAEAHNVYGMQMARASRDGALGANPNERPFVISRAGYAGVQRHALVWTGDNSSLWEHLADSVQMLLNLSVSGVAHCGADAGGFIENCTGELLARWMQLAALTPFFRNHSTINSLAQEPWAFGRRIERICREAIELRYRLLPYLYGLFVEAHRKGAPIMRPMYWHYQDDPVAVAAGDQFLLGPDLLVAPILRQGAQARSVYLPAGEWCDFWSGKRHEGGQQVLALAPLERIPLFVRAGAIVPMGPVRQHTQGRAESTVELHVWVGGKGELNWYEDDGHSMDYERGGFSERLIEHSSNADEGKLTFAAASGGAESAVREWRIVLHEVDGTPAMAIVGQTSQVVKPLRGGILQFRLKNQTGPLFTAQWTKISGRRRRGR